MSGNCRNFVALRTADDGSEDSAVTLQELAHDLVALVRHHERNCRHCASVGLACVECPECRAIMEDEILDALRKVNRK